MDPHIEYYQLQPQEQQQSVYYNNYQSGIDMNTDLLLGSTFQPDQTIIYQQNQQQNNYFNYQQDNTFYLQQQQQLMNSSYMNSFGSNNYFEQQEYAFIDQPLNDNKIVYVPVSPLQSIPSNFSSPNLMDDQFSSTMSIVSTSSNHPIGTSMNPNDHYFSMIDQTIQHHHSLIEPLSPPYSPYHRSSISSTSSSSPFIMNHKKINNKKRKSVSTKKTIQKQPIQQAILQLFNEGATLKQEEEEEKEDEELKQCTKLYVCNFKGCGKEFGRQYNLKSHLICHQDKKPFKCDQCSKEFARNHDFKRHSFIHNKIRIHKCVNCPAEFYRSDGLLRHYNKNEICDRKLLDYPNDPANLRRKRKATPTGYGEKKKNQKK